MASAGGAGRATDDVRARRADALRDRVGFVGARQDGAEGTTAPAAGQGEALETVRWSIPGAVAVTIERLDSGHDTNLDPAAADGKRKSRRSAAVGP